MSIKFLIVSQLPPPVHGSTVMTRLFMHSLQNLGHDVVIVEKNFSKKQEDVEKFSIVKVFKAPILVFKLLCQLTLDKQKICFYFITIGRISFIFDAFMILILKLFGVDYILYSHGKGLKGLAEKSGTVLKSIIKHTLSGALGALVLGEKLKDDLNLFVPNERLFILPNAIPDFQREQAVAARNADQPLQILFLSNLSPAKGPLEFVKMAGAVHRRNKNVRFVLAGKSMSDAFSQEIMKCIDQEGIREVITIPGPVYGADKEKLFRGTDIFVFPSHREAFPLVNLEAMQYGIPVISTAEGGIPEAVIDGFNGFIVDPNDIDQMADRVHMLVEDEALCGAMGRAGRERYEQFYTIEAYEKRLAESITFFHALRQTSRNKPS